MGFLGICTRVRLHPLHPGTFLPLHPGADEPTMSVLFIIMLYKRDSSEGQSMLIAVAKWLGTLAPTIQQGLVQNFNIFILLTGLLCSVWDILYIVLLKRKIDAEKKG